uniref:Death domain-containing protein n=1 Tax=Amphimedon queenslandica TaxID=400682 RepID=A0A1X7TJ69_AMPQE
MAVGGDVSILDINDLDSILTELDQGQFSEVKWEDFGLKAGLSQNTLEKIKTDNRGDTHQCLKKCLSCWLKRQDNVDDKGEPSWRRLAEILEELGERALADTIRGRRGVSSEEQQVCPVPTSGHSISLAKPLEKQFQQMLIEFLNILTRFVNQVFKRRQRLKDVKTCLAGIGHNQRNKKEIDEVQNESGLMYLLRSYCSLREFSIDIFGSLGIYIQLKTVHNSLLTFVCVIPHWLVEEMKDYVMKNGDLFKSKGVVEITVDGTIVFSVKPSLEPHQLPIENEEKEEESLQQNEEEAEEECIGTQEDRRSYACLMFYEKNSFIYFTAVPVKMLTALLEYIKDHHRFADIGPIHYFHFKWFNGFIELSFNENPPAGWTVIPLIKPCRLYQEDIDSFDGTDESIPPYCFISFQGSPDAVPTLHYPIPLVGVADPVTLFIHRTLKSTAPPVAPYTGLVYHEKKEEKHLMIFTAARLKDISNAVNCIEEQYPLARINQLIGFDFDSNHDRIELILDAPQDQSITGWTIEPHSTKLLKNQIDRFSFTKTLPSSCLVSFYSSPDAVPTLHYSVPLVGVAETKAIDLLLESAMTSLQMSYVGLIYYEWKGKEYLITFTASKKLNHLLKYIEEYHPLAEIGQVYNFSFSPSSGFIELLFNDSCKGWTVQPLVKPCRLYQKYIDKCGEANYLLPSSCLVSVYASPDAVPTLHYSVPLVGVADPVTIFIDRKLQLEKKEMKLQKYIESLHQELQVVYQSIVFLQEALTRANEQGSKVAIDHNKLVTMSKKLEEVLKEKQILTEDNEKLRAAVASNEVWIIEMEEEKEQLEEQYLIDKQITEESKTTFVVSDAYITEWEEENEKVKEQYLKEKQITKELKAKVSDNELYTAKLLKEKEQLQERVTSIDLMEKQLTEDNEKLRATVADKEVYIAEIEEDKKQVKEEKRKVEEEKQILTEDNEKLRATVADLEGKEEQYLKEKQIIIDDNQNLIAEKDKVIAKLTSQVEEQSQNEEQIIRGLKEKDLYIAKLWKERQEKSKETYSIGLQFNYLIPSMDNLDCLSDVQVAERKLFLIQGDRPQLMNWEKYGLRIGVQEDTLSPTDTVEAAVVALVGGQFQFPPNTVLVSAVYAVSLSKPLLKRLKLEIQHCIDLTGRPDLAQYLKFAIAPVSTPSLSYHFSIVEGGEFSSNSGYGSIDRKEYCLVCIL